MPDAVRCFVGLPLPQACGPGLDALALRLADRLCARVSWTRPGNWHVTLRFLGEVAAERVPGICAALGAIDFAPVTLRLGCGGFFPPGEACGTGGGRGAPRTLWAGLTQGGEACSRLAGLVDQALAPCGFGAQARSYRPHVTLGRVKQACQAGGGTGDDWEAAAREVEQGLAGALFAPARVGEMLLWRSVLGPQGPKYAALRSFPARDHGGSPERGEGWSA